MTHFDRNYFTLEKVSPDDLEIIRRSHNKMIDLGIIRKSQDPKNLELPEEDQRYEETESFKDYMSGSLSRMFWHRDWETGELKKFSNPKMAKKAKHREEDFEKMRKGWIERGGKPDQWIEYYTVMTMADLILEYKIISQVTKSYLRDYPDHKGPIPMPMNDIYRLAELEQQKLDEEGNTDYEDMARLIYGWKKYKYESHADRLLTKRLVHYEIMTDTGHLTTYFMDLIRECAKDMNMTIEQVAEDESTLFALVVEGTREEDYTDPKEYLEKKSHIEREEYDQTARMVGRLLKLQIVKQKEESQ